MDQISLIAAAGMQSRMQSLDIVANNLANSSTGGYKGDNEFYTVFTSEAANEDGPGVPTTLPMVQKHWTDFSQGLLESTSNPLDMGLQGKGFFAVAGPSGPLYTRHGSFHLSPTGTIVNADGYALLDRTGQSIKLTPNQPLELSHDGTLSQNGQALGQVQLVDFTDPGAVAKQGHSYFQNVSGKAPADAADLQVYQGKVEASNVSAPHGAMRLVSLTRQFEMMQKAISIASEMGRQAIEQVAKVG
jgi:flagellar basal-body rod protein FlgF